MSELFIYLIKANIALCLFYLAYRLGLRRLTFYTLNRFFLLTGIVFSSLFPLVDVNDFFNRNEKLAQQVVTYVPDLTAWQQPVQADAFTIWTLLAWVFWAGVAVMTLRLVMQLVSLFYLHRNTDPASIEDRNVRVMGSSMNPFSFFRHIYINPSLHSPEELQAILQHESIHVREWHSADVLMGEVNNIFYWFNPGAWLMKTAIKENLEFLTDRKMLRKGVDKKSYQYSLVQVSAAQYAAGIANNFNFSHLKNRIKMMNKQKSSRVHVYRYAVLGCLTCGVLLSLNFTKAGTVVNKAVEEVKIALDVTPRDTVPARAALKEVKAEAVPKVTPMKIEVVKNSDSALTLHFTDNKMTGTTNAIHFKTAIAKQSAAIPQTQGRIAGVLIRANGDTTPVKQQGSLSMRMSAPSSQNPPLFILDGEPMLDVTPGTNALQHLDPNDIESISVLKDQSSAAIYGSAGKNGVIIITTKKKAKAGAKTSEELKEIVIDAYNAKQLAPIKSDELKEVVVVGYGTKSPDPEGAQTLKSVVVVADTTTRLSKQYRDITVKGLATTSSINKHYTDVSVTGTGTASSSNLKKQYIMISDVTTGPTISGVRDLGVKSTKEAKHENVESGASVTVSPNPASGIFNVTYSLPKGGKGYLEVKDMSGKPVYNKKLDSAGGTFKEQIDLSRFPAGIYILTLSAPGVNIVSRLSKT